MQAAVFSDAGVDLQILPNFRTLNKIFYIVIDFQ